MMIGTLRKIRSLNLDKMRVAGNRMLAVCNRAFSNTKDPLKEYFFLDMNIRWGKKNS